LTIKGTRQPNKPRLVPKIALSYRGERKKREREKRKKRKGKDRSRACIRSHGCPRERKGGERKKEKRRLFYVLSLHGLAWEKGWGKRGDFPYFFSFEMLHSE